MRVLLDECMPKRLKRLLVGHLAHTVQEMGWATKSNGELLQLMLAHQFEVLVTVDKNLPYQQNLRAAKVAVLVMAAKSNRMIDLNPLVPATLQALNSIQPGDLVEIPTP